MKSIITTLIILFTSIIGISQHSDYSKLDSFFTILAENDRFMGSVAVIGGDEVLYSKALGYADVESKITNNSETKFRVGSISKTFTATLVMKAVELGKINLDDTIDHYFPRVQNAQDITVRHLLNHRSGITNFTDRSYFSWYTKPITQAALLDTIISKGIDFKPNTDYAYSNSNYVLLTFILEDVFDSSFDTILDEHIVNPLQLKNTGYGETINTSQNEAKSYTMGTTWEIELEGDMSIPLGAGGIVSTPTDLCLFVKALLSGKLISTLSVQEMKPAGDDSYGFALYNTPFNDKNGWGHGGNIDAFASNMIYFEEEDICFAISCSGSNFGMHDVELAVLSEIFDQPYELPSFDSVELTSEELDQYLGTYVTDDLPMDMIITKDGSTLMLEATGQSASTLQAKGDHKFVIMQYGVKMEFVPQESKLNFEQQGHKFVLQLQEDVKEEVTNTINKKVGDLDKYVGTYTSDLLPIDLTISQQNNQLIGQGEGQPSFELSSDGDHKYSNKEIGLTITFIPEEKKMKFEQGSAAFEMTSIE